MTTSDTPETDAAVIASGGSWSFVLRETCRRLERERDEARESAAKWEAVALREASINGARICAKEDAK